MEDIVDGNPRLNEYEVQYMAFLQDEEEGGTYFKKSKRNDRKKWNSTDRQHK